MTYQALARRWRPHTFADVVGQQHVVSALSNALDNDRVHHAFLFTGTRGVGKTTLARILAKALNCEKGVSSKPCGKCSACTSIDEGRFIDLLEVDAASRTKVDDTRELLDNVQYTPTQGRFKVYLIDEVHMLSGHSFNALLKTLEEPPPHVKFLLATTDPQKLPATILSRCLQFNLRALDVEQITQQLEKILKAEKIKFDKDALTILARSAAGSLRDGLSLLDQAIAFAGGKLETDSVRDMLGMIDHHHVVDLLTHLASQDAAAVLSVVTTMSEQSVDYVTALDDLLLLMHLVALYQQVPDAVDKSSFDEQSTKQFAEQLSAEDLQLFYQIGLLGKRDLPLAPDPRTGFEMTLLRMLAFKPDSVSGETIQPTRAQSSKPVPAKKKAANNVASVKHAVQPVNVTNITNSIAEPVAPKPTLVSQTNADTAKTNIVKGNIEQTLGDAEAWADLICRLNISSITREVAMNIAPLNLEDGVLSVVLDNAHKSMHNADRQGAIEQELSKALAQDIKLKVQISDDAPSETAAKTRARQRQQAIAQAHTDIENDPNVQELMDRFGATIIPESVMPAGDEVN